MTYGPVRQSRSGALRRLMQFSSSPNARATANGHREQPVSVPVIKWGAKQANDKTSW